MNIDFRPLVWLALFGLTVIVLGVTAAVAMLLRWLILWLFF